MLESEGVQNSQCRCPETGVISCGHKFFLPVKVLSVVFRGKFLAALERAFKKHKLTLAGQLTPLQSPAEFAALLRAAAHRNWVVYAKRPFCRARAGPDLSLSLYSPHCHRQLSTPGHGRR